MLRLVGDDRTEMQIGPVLILNFTRANQVSQSPYR